MTQPLRSKLSSMRTERRNYCLSQPETLPGKIASLSFLELSWNFLTKFWNWNGTGTDRILILGQGKGTELVPILVRRIGTGSRSKKNGAVTMYDIVIA